MTGFDILYNTKAADPTYFIANIVIKKGLAKLLHSKQTAVFICYDLPLLLYHICYIISKQWTFLLQLKQEVQDTGGSGYDSA